MLALTYQTPAHWAQTPLANFDEFLQDHASCERKASATAMSLAAHFQDRISLVLAMVELAKEELTHFGQVFNLMVERGVALGADRPDPYVKGLLTFCRTGRDNHFLDRMLIAGIVEARGCERFGLIAEALEPGPMKEFYLDITRSEARHHGLFVRLAREYFTEDVLRTRLNELLVREGELVASLPFRAALH